MLRRLAKSLAYAPQTQRFAERLEILFPPLRVWHRAQYQRHFQKFYAWERLFQGVYPSAETALTQIPKDRPIGYDNPEAAQFLGRTSPMLPSEYPILFWLGKLLQQNPTILDLGGYLGLSYNWYKPYSIYPPDLRWTVYDVPSVVQSGLSILAREPDPTLHFTANFTEAASANILLASGSLQFCPQRLAAMLAPLPTRPTHLLVNKLPTTHLPTFYTLHNMGPAIAPYRIFNRAEFVTSLAPLGYELVDSWKNPELSCFIPFHPDESVSAYEGFYFRKRSD
jgi:putative methyltransferase (TIGR04325 family)